MTEKFITLLFLCLTQFSSILCESNEKRSELGTIEIDDLFQIEKINEKSKIDSSYLDENFSNPISDEDLGLESLEIKDIDIITFGEYEDFLNKFYDENFLDLNSRFINQKEFVITGIGGTTIPFGANVKAFHSLGSNFGIIIDTPLEFYVNEILFDILGEVSFSTLTSTHPDVFDYRIVNIMGSTKVDFLKLLYSRINISILNSSSGQINNETSGWGLSGSVDLGISLNFKGFNIGTYLRAQTILAGLLDPPMYGGGTGEIISMGLSFGKPIYIQF